MSEGGGGEAYVREQWVPFDPGDFAFFPPGVPHSVRVPASAERDLVVVTAISPPEFDLYADSGFYNIQYGVINEEAAFFAHQNAMPGELSPVHEMRYSETTAEVRPWNLDVAEINSGGALFNVFRGAKIDVIDAPMLFLLGPGYGPRSTGFHFATGETGMSAAVHAHPAADECVVLWAGQARAYACGRWHDMDTRRSSAWMCRRSCYPADRYGDPAVPASPRGEGA